MQLFSPLLIDNIVFTEYSLTIEYCLALIAKLLKRLKPEYLNVYLQVPWDLPLLQ